MSDVYIPPDYGFEPDISGMEYSFEEMDRLRKKLIIYYLNLKTQ
jgi:hypothetical protein